MALELVKNSTKRYNTRASNSLLNLKFEYDFDIDVACETKDDALRRCGYEFSDLEDSDDEWKMPEEISEHELKARKTSQFALEKRRKGKINRVGQKLFHTEQKKSSTVSRYGHKTETEQNEPRTKRRNRICSNNTTRAGQIAKNYRERKKDYFEALKNRIEALEKENRMIMEEITRFEFLVQTLNIEMALELVKNSTKRYNTRASNSLLNLKFEYDFDIDVACETKDDALRRCGYEFSDLEDSDDEWKMPEEISEHELKARKTSQFALEKRRKGKINRVSQKLFRTVEKKSSTVSRYGHETETEQNEPRTKRRNRICRNNTTRAGQIAKNYREKEKRIMLKL
ncbi:hypothetical protein QYM36_012740 [Artemia franciscana]|uniref:BZIP domain-containing protein n=1 Tax=Artemia franciscana TaxID=6661 RepID=A0AA88HMQ8_ARTSF|nr:hypothetical protein QYM36_012740 [Artemia franciscana]